MHVINQKTEMVDGHCAYLGHETSVTLTIICCVIFFLISTVIIFLQDSAGKCDELRVVECILPCDGRQGKIVSGLPDIRIFKPLLPLKYRTVLFKKKS